MGARFDAVQFYSEAFQHAQVAHFPLQPTPEERLYLSRGLTQPGGKLPLFDGNGRRVDAALVRACVANGWVQPWFANPLKPDWLVCKLTAKGRRAISA
jgi:hypothetical protein